MKKTILILLCVMLVMVSFVGCSSNNDKAEVGTQAQIKEENTQDKNNKDTEPLAEYQYPIAQGVQSFKSDEVLAVKYLVYKPGFVSALDKNFPQNAEGQIKETLVSYFVMFQTDGIKTFTHDTIKIIQKDKQNYVLESGKINGYNFKGIYTVSNKDPDYVIMSCYIELDDDTSGIDAIIGQTFDLNDFS